MIKTNWSKAHRNGAVSFLARKVERGRSVVVHRVHHRPSLDQLVRQVIATYQHNKAFVMEQAKLSEVPRRKSQSITIQRPAIQS